MKSAARPGSEHADPVAAGHETGIDLGRRAQRRGRGEAEILDEQLELAGMPFAIGGDRETGVGSGQQRHAGGARLLPIGAADLVLALRMLGAALLDRPVRAAG